MIYLCSLEVVFDYKENYIAEHYFYEDNKIYLHNLSFDLYAYTDIIHSNLIFIDKFKYTLPNDLILVQEKLSVIHTISNMLEKIIFDNL